MEKITKTGTKGIELIKKFEGFMSKPYKCPAGIPTIAYGATFYPNGKKVTMSDKAVTEAEGVELLKSMLSKFEQYVDSYCIDTITQNQFDALVSFAYNVGTGALKKSTLLKKVNADPNDKFIESQFLIWNKVKGVEVKGLTLRRQAESKLYFS
jgi:lysozyme